MEEKKRLAENNVDPLDRLNRAMVPIQTEKKRQNNTKFAT